MTERNKGILLMITGSLFAAIMAALVKTTGDLPTAEKLFFRSPDMIVFYYTGMTSLVSLPFMLGSRFQAPTLPQLGSMLAAGVAATISQWLLSCAYRYSKAGDLSLYLYANTVFATLLGLIFWHEIPDFLSLAGIILVLTGACINTYSS